MAVDKDINVVGKACPMPLIALAREVRGMHQGQVVRIIGNDPIFESSVVDCCQERGHTILETSRDGRGMSWALEAALVRAFLHLLGKRETPSPEQRGIGVRGPRTLTFAIGGGKL